MSRPKIAVIGLWPSIVLIIVDPGTPLSQFDIETSCVEHQCHRQSGFGADGMMTLKLGDLLGRPGIVVFGPTPSFV